jgi:hypothetical protein
MEYNSTVARFLSFKMTQIAWTHAGDEKASPSAANGSILRSSSDIEQHNSNDLQHTFNAAELKVGIFLPKKVANREEIVESKMACTFCQM